MGRRLLLIEDDSDSADALGLFLGLEGYDVRRVESGLAALEALTASSDAGGSRPDWFPDAILLDLTLPDMEGVEVGRRIREMWSDVRIVLLSARQPESIHAAAAAVGAAATLRKPFDLANLVARVEEVLAIPARP
jgi:DNA-binding response OmpR family regulator